MKSSTALIFNVLLFISRLPVFLFSEDSEGIFTSNTDLQSLLWTEKELVKSLKEYIKAEELKLEQLRK